MLSASGRTRCSSASPWIGEGELGALGGEAAGDAPGDGAVIGDAHDQAPLARHERAGGGVCERRFGHGYMGPMAADCGCGSRAWWHTPARRARGSGLPAHPAQSLPPGISAMDSSAADPFARSRPGWRKPARSEPNDPNAVCLATARRTGMPSARMVLLKGVDPRGFVFYTNLESRKGGELLANPNAALLLPLEDPAPAASGSRGRSSAVTDAEADAYYASRARGSRIGAWASRQSRPLESRFALEKAVAEYTMKFGICEIPRPGILVRLPGGAAADRVLAGHALPPA